MRTVTWLHLSDWHQGRPDYDRRVVRDELIADLERRVEIDERLATIDFIVFSGDLSFSGEESEYEQAIRDLLDPLLNVTGVPKKLFFMVPGNHDVHRNTLRFLRPFQFKERREVNQALSDKASRRILLQPMDNYSRFVGQFWGADAVAEPAYSFLCPFEVHGIRVTVVGMNSSWMCGQRIESGEVNDFGCLILGEPQFYDPMQEPDFKRADLRIGVLHHPFHWLGDLVRRSFVQRSLTQGFHFLLRGHEHDSDIGITSGTGGQCAILSAGAAYDHREHPNGYNFVHVDLDAGQGTVFLRRYEMGRGFHKDTVNTDDNTPGYHQFILPKKLGRPASASGLFPGPAPAPAPRPVVSVCLVRDYRDPNLIPALDLYDGRIPAHERFEASDVIRWLREGGNFFYVAKLEDRVCGFALLHYHPEQRLAFVAYVVAEKGVAVDNGTISAHLMTEVARLFEPGGELEECRGILLEVDDPRTAETEEERNQRIARIRLFCTLAQRESFALRALDLDYRHPLLQVPAEGEEGHEASMILMYAKRPAAGATLPRSEVEELLAFIYKWLYPEGFSEIPEENQAYQRYLDRLYEAQVRILPDEIPTLGLSQIRVRCAASKKITKEDPS